ncbi:hypothetical protein B0H17DRAFT_1122531, partial [Mycena rosella]
MSAASSHHFYSLLSTTTILPSYTLFHNTLIIPHSFIMSSLSSRMLAALLRLVRFLFGGGRCVDLESGNAIPARKDNDVMKKREPQVPKAAVPTFKPDMAGVPALAIASMALSAAVAPVAPMHIVATTLVIPRTIITPPPDDRDDCVYKEESVKIGAVRKDTDTRAMLVPLKQVTNLSKRVHGQALLNRKAPMHKENLRAHPNAPRRPQLAAASPPPLPPLAPITRKLTVINVPVAPPVQPVDKPVPAVDAKVAGPCSSEWEHEKAHQLEEARIFSEKVKDRRRRSLPTPPPPPPPASSPTTSLTRHVSAPARLSLQERLERACTAAVPAALAVPVAPLWGDVHVRFVIEDDDENEDETKITLRTREDPIAPAVPVAPLWSNEHVLFVIGDADEDEAEIEASEIMLRTREEQAAPEILDTSLPSLSVSSSSSAGSLSPYSTRWRPGSTHRCGSGCRASRSCRRFGVVWMTATATTQTTGRTSSRSRTTH